MNHNRNVLVFTLVTTFLLLCYSLFATIYHVHVFDLENISIVSDVLHEADDAMPDSKHIVINDSVPTAPAAAVANDGPLPPRRIEEYKKRRNITAFYTDTGRAALPTVMHKLYAMRQGKKDKVRIAWFGDSMIEADLLTQTFRKRIQQFFGGFGAGFVPATSVTAGFRTSVSHKWTGNWKEENFKSTDLSGPLFLSGHLFYTADGTIKIKDNTVKDTNQLIEKYLICGPAEGSISVTVNGQARQYSPGKRINRLLLDKSRSKSLDLAIANDKLRVYGVATEPESGVIVDNFSFRGITGLELGKLDTTFLKTVQTERPYDLVVLEYGANLLFRPDDKDYSWYLKHIIPVVRKLQKAMPNAEFLIISTADRAFKYGEKWSSAVGIDNLVASQAELAFGNGTAFYNMFASMGGAGTIVSWADSTPSLANKDYIHPNLRGAEILGNMLFDDFMKDYQRAQVPDADSTNYVTTACGSIIDTRNSLEWYVAEDKDYTWAKAGEWAKSLSVCNGGWGLPTAAQVLTLYNTRYTAGVGYKKDSVSYPAKMNPAFNNIGHGSWVWTGEEVDVNKAIAVNLNQGVKVGSQKNTVSYPVRVLAVRKINTQKSGT